MPYIQSTLSSKHQIVVPSEVRKALKLSSGDSILWRITQMSDQPKAVAEPMPKKWADRMKGLGKDLWKKVSIDEYIDSLRNEWQPV